MGSVNVYKFIKKKKVSGERGEILVYCLYNKNIHIRDTVKINSRKKKKTGTHTKIQRHRLFTLGERCRIPTLRHLKGLERRRRKDRTVKVKKKW